ncbi:MAG: iron-sulfur cluster insertion protein ErpA [Bdellovibrio sp.]|nr:MAG: iron-sulfur cluster insertion protein ErpA [Bdellovibrio sp.]
MIQVSPAAAKRIQELKKEEGKDLPLRIKVKRGGCSGFSYKLDFDNQVQDKDKTFESNGVQIIVDEKSLLYVLGMTLDFEGGLNGQGFVFINPNATKTCGCGSSFSV